MAISSGRRRRPKRRAPTRWRRLIVEWFEPRELLAPVAIADSYATPEDTPLSIAAPGILANDTGGATSAVLDNVPAHGTLNLNLDGSFSYTPAKDYNGADSFSYRASDGTTTSNPAAVSLT